MTAHSVRRFIEDAADGPVPAAPELWGLSGVHTGVLAAVTASASGQKVPGASLRSLTAVFHAGMLDPATVAVDVAHRTVARTTTSARIASGETLHVTAAAFFGLGDTIDSGCRVPTRPGGPGPLQCPVLDAPPASPAVVGQFEVRQVGPNRPFGGGWEPELVAWVRLSGDEAPPDAAALIVLLDALGPSWTAVLSEPVAAPTVEMSYHPSAGIALAASPWVLVRARTRSIEPSGWVTEQVDAWGPDGTYLAGATQVRLVRRIVRQPAN